MPEIATNGMAPKRSVFDLINERAAVSKAGHTARLSLLARESLDARGLAVGDRDQASWWRHADYWVDGEPGVVNRSTEHEAIQAVHDFIRPPKLDDDAMVWLPEAQARPTARTVAIVPVETLAERRAQKQAERVAVLPDWSRASVPDVKPRHRRKLASKAEQM
jgi:hypothetical protein